jgi:hypothetical protein
MCNIIGGSGTPIEHHGTSSQSSRGGTSVRRDGTPAARGGSSAQSSTGGTPEGGTVAPQGGMPALSARGTGAFFLFCILL